MECQLYDDIDEGLSFRLIQRVSACIETKQLISAIYLQYCIVNNLIQLDISENEIDDLERLQEFKQLQILDLLWCPSQL
ncbi:Leucine-rich_repeat [Hexamita inflata]|uniref:Leucine-rich_repeat n=1 Tax=Hexamita inflata TaxID=28002 RepID=A0ABP1J4W4_9EUKA